MKLATSARILGRSQKCCFGGKTGTAQTLTPSKQKRCLNRYSQQEYRPGGKVCYPLTPNKQEVQAKTRVSNAKTRVQFSALGRRHVTYAVELLFLHYRHLLTFHSDHSWVADPN